MGRIQLQIGCVLKTHLAVVYATGYLELKNFRIWIHPYPLNIWMHNRIFIYIWPTLVKSTKGES
jgi:hypothetical protein